MKNKRTIILILSLFTIVIAALVYNYVFYGEHRNIAEEEATVALSDIELHNQFLKDESLANTNYLDKVIEATGVITSVEGNSVTLSNSLEVVFNTDVTKELKKGKSITVKGRCVGYDDLLEVVKIDQATITNN